jgi:hypothetical protein
MKPPRVHPIVRDIVHSGISAVDGVVFSGHSGCPACGGRLTGYDTKRKQFARIVTEDGPRTMYVDVKRFYCRSCHRFCLADNPFYPGTRIGSVIVDLCIALSMTVPDNRVPAYLAAMGVLVDRSSSRLYIRHIGSCHVRINARYIDIDDRAGIHLPISVLSLFALVTDPGRGGSTDERQVLEACEFPSASRTACNFPLPQKRWMNRDDAIR